MAYATPAELASWMGLPPFADDDLGRATLKLDVATGLIDDVLGQSLDLASTTDDLDGTGTDALVLSRWPVESVDSVVVDGQLLDPEEYEVERAGLLTRNRSVWRCDENIIVVYTAGYAEIPASVKGLCLELVSGTWTNVHGHKSERVADYAVVHAREGMGLSTLDKKQLGRYSASR